MWRNKQDEDTKENREMAETVKRRYGEGVGFAVESHGWTPMLFHANRTDEEEKEVVGEEGR